MSMYIDTIQCKTVEHSVDKSRVGDGEGQIMLSKNVACDLTVGRKVASEVKVP